MAENKETKNKKQSNPLVGSGIKSVTLDNTTKLDIDTKKVLVDNIIEAGLSSKLDVAAIENFTSISNSRDQIYQLIDTMAQDSSVAAILRTYAEYTVSNDNGLVSLVSDDAYIPTLVISRSPSGNADDATILENGNTVGGGGVMLEAFNLLCSLWMESFLGTAEDIQYILTEQNIDSVESVMILSENGVYEEINSSDYTVDNKKGIVTFLTSPGARDRKSVV